MIAGWWACFANLEGDKSSRAWLSSTVGGEQETF